MGDEYQNNSCEKFVSLYKRYLEIGNVDLRANLRMVENGETERWLEETKRKFTCKNCDDPIVAGARMCQDIVNSFVILFPKAQLTIFL